MKLRDQIAEALADAITNSTDLEPDGEDFVIDCHPLADAVIEKLGLREDRQQGPYSHMRRYVTDYKSDDD